MVIKLDNHITAGNKWDIAFQKRLLSELYLEQYGFKVFSQNDEDGIIEEIFNRIGTTNKKFVEFGVENGLECNSHFLLHKGWSGLWIEGSEVSYKKILKNFRPVILEKKLSIKNAFVSIDNINNLIYDAGIQGEIDLLSIDIDGNDYYIFDIINVIKPRVISIEYNGKFAPSSDWVMPYNKEHLWDESHNHGASLLALEKLGNKKGYQLVGTNTNGVNAFFVKKELCKNLFPSPSTAENLYNPLRLSMQFKNGHPAKKCLVNSQTGVEGQFVYLDKNEKYLSSYGFYEKEYDENYNFLQQWMKAKKAKIFIKNENVSEITLHLHNEIETMNLIWSFGENQTTTCPLTVGHNKILISVPKEFQKNTIIPLFLEVNEMWTPFLKYGSEDKRILGIALLEITL